MVLAAVRYLVKVAVDIFLEIFSCCFSSVFEPSFYFFPFGTVVMFISLSDPSYVLSLSKLLFFFAFLLFFRFAVAL